MEVVQPSYDAERKSALFLTSMRWLRNRAGRRGKWTEQDHDMYDGRGVISGLPFMDVSTNRTKGLAVQTQSK